MMASPQASVVIPLFNKKNEIGRTLRSVLNQREPPVAILVVDDGSTDGGAEIVRSFSDPRIRLIEQKNAGVSAARNRGMTESPTDLAAFLDADDEWHPDFLLTVLDLYKRFPEAGLWGTSFSLRFAEDAPDRLFQFPGVPLNPEGGLVKDFFLSSVKVPIICASGMLCHRSVLKEVGWFPEGVKLGEDMDVWIRIALRYPVAYNARPLVIYHKGATNRAMDRERHTQRETCVYLTLKKALEINEFPYTRRSSVRKLMGTHLLDIARSALANNNAPLARSLIFETLRYRVWWWRCLRRWIRTYSAGKAKQKQG